MKLNKLTTLCVVDEIEASLPEFEALGYTVTVRVPENSPLDFVILAGASGELMLQTRRSLAEDLPSVAELEPSSLLYADVKSLSAAKKALPRARVLVSERQTFYGATESWLLLESGVVLGLAQH